MCSEGSLKARDKINKGWKYKCINTKQNSILILPWSATDSILYFPDRHLWSFLSLRIPFPFHSTLICHDHIPLSFLQFKNFPSFASSNIGYPWLWSPNHSFSQCPRKYLKHSSNLKHFLPFALFSQSQDKVKNKAGWVLWCPSPPLRNTP